MCYDKYTLKRLYILKHLNIICARCKRPYPKCVEVSTEFGYMCPICYCLIKSNYETMQLILHE